MRRLPFLAALLATAITPSLRAQSSGPPMGWNSWDAYGLTVTEPQFRDNVAVLRDKLKPFGYTYAVIDEGWFFANPEARPHPETLIYAIDAHGRYVPVPERFPSARVSAAPQPAAAPGKLSARIEDTTFAPLAAWVHAQGLKFGIHIVRGIPRASVERNLPIDGSDFHAQDAADTGDACPWDPTNWGVKDNAAGQAWYDSLLAQYAAWGVDLLKVDCIADHPYKADEIRMIRRAIDKAGRPMVLSLSPGPTDPAHADEVAKLATMWRISNDVWDVWEHTGEFPQPIKGQFDRAAQWASLHLPQGRYPDLDMLPLGELRPSPGWGEPRHTRLTSDEQKTLLTLWAINQSPLIIGANLILLDRETLGLLTNRTMLRIDQNGSKPRELVHQGALRIWRAELPQGGLAVAFFNDGDKQMPVDDGLTALHNVIRPSESRKLSLRDAWTGNPLGKMSQIPPHGCVLLQSR